MKIEIDTVTKTITIESATGKELLKLAKKYKDYTFESKVVENWSYPYFPYVPQPFYYTTSEGTTSDVTLLNGNTTNTINN